MERLQHEVKVITKSDYGKGYDNFGDPELIDKQGNDQQLDIGICVI